jgi:hypothetical protein
MGWKPARQTDERPDRDRDPPSSVGRLLMSVVLALAAFPVLAILLMALSRAEESLSHVTERRPVRH